MNMCCGRIWPKQTDTLTNDTVNLAVIRERIAKMNDEALKRYGRAAAFMGKRPRNPS